MKKREITVTARKKVEKVNSPSFSSSRQGKKKKKRLLLRKCTISTHENIIANLADGKLRMITLKDFKENSVKDFYIHTHGRYTQKKRY